MGVLLLLYEHTKGFERGVIYGSKTLCLVLRIRRKGMKRAKRLFGKVLKKSCARKPYYDIIHL